MDILNKYAIAYKGLGAGKHDYVFGLDGPFFRAFDNPDIPGGNGTAEVALTKSESMLEVDVRIRAQITVPCDRCLEDCIVPVDFDGGFKVRFRDAKNVNGPNDDFDGEIMWLGHGESMLNLAQYIYESIVLSLPYVKVHPDGEDGCDPGSFENVRMITQEEFERAEEGGKMQKMEDNPEWQKLREIRNKL